MSPEPFARHCRLGRSGPDSSGLDLPYARTRLVHRLTSAAVVCLLVIVVGCQTPPGGGKAAARKRTGPQQPPVRRVRCLYELRPWLNLDEPGDRDPEGIRYRIFLDTGTAEGVLREGMFHINMYQINRVGPDRVERILVSDWHYPTSSVHTIARPGMLGEGYFVHLVWADKDVAGHEIEIITSFEDPEGRMARSGTKRLRVPKYVF